MLWLVCCSSFGSLLIIQVQQKKVKSGNNTHQVNKKMRFEVFQLLCEHFLSGDTSQCWRNIFLPHSWSWIKSLPRSENVTDCHELDCLLSWVSFQKRKGAQLGVRQNAIWHVYATSACCYLFLACYSFSYPRILTKVTSNADFSELADHDNVKEDNNTPVSNDPRLGMATNVCLNSENKLFPIYNKMSDSWSAYTNW